MNSSRSEVRLEPRKRGIKERMFKMRKLIRDSIPTLIMGDKKENIDKSLKGIRKMSGWEYEYALQLKLSEEWAEFWAAPSAEELGDCLEVLHAAAYNSGIDWADVEKERKFKRKTRGGFLQGWELSTK